MRDRRVLAGAALAVAAGVVTFSCRPAWVPLRPAAATRTVQVFRDNMIHFAPDDSTAYDTDQVIARDKGRVIVRHVTLPELEGPTRITARLVVKPVPKDEVSVHDRWDRAGNVRLSLPGMAEIELVKFVTSYGGRTEHTVDVSHLAPVLQGPCDLKGFIDTWVTPAWRIDLALEFESLPGRGGWGPPPSRRPADRGPDWAWGLLFAESVTAENQPEEGLAASFKVPAETNRIVLCYLASGHCTDGRGADEFVSKDHVIRIDGREVYRFQPWRDDCRRFREINPYCRRWSDGTWSADFSRSGWCPGDVVLPVEIDLTEVVGPGNHTARVLVEDVRPRGEDDHLGYWRVSAYLLGWSDR